MTAAERYKPGWLIALLRRMGWRTRSNESTELGPVAKGRCRGDRFSNNLLCTPCLVNVCPGNTFRHESLQQHQRVPGKLLRIRLYSGTPPLPRKPPFPRRADRVPSPDRSILIAHT